LGVTFAEPKNFHVNSNAQKIHEKLLTSLPGYRSHIESTNDAMREGRKKCLHPLPSTEHPVEVIPCTECLRNKRKSFRETRITETIDHLVKGPISAKNHDGARDVFLHDMTDEATGIVGPTSFEKLRLPSANAQARDHRWNEAGPSATTGMGICQDVDGRQSVLLEGVR
jgi:hypothetical protein